MTSLANIGLALRAQAAATPELPALLAPDLTLSFAKLWRLVDCFACRMAEAGIGPEARVGLETGDRIVAVCTLFAAALVGAEFVPVDPPLLQVPALRPTHFLRSPDVPGLPGLPAMVLNDRWSPRSGPGSPDGGASWPGYAGVDAPAWIVQSSGTTGRPKFMRLDAALVQRRVAAVMTEFDPGRTRMAALFGCLSRPFLIRAAAALLSGCAIVDSTDPAALQRFGVTLVCGSPRLVRDWLGGRRLDPRIDRLQCSGAKLSAEETRRFLDSFAQVEDVYGASETIKAYVNLSRLQGGAMVTVGQPAAGAEVEIRDDAGQPCAPGVAGSLRIRTGCVAQGYAGDAAATAQSFRDGWFHPGDLAAWGPQGRLDVIGRTSDVVNLGGLKVALGEVDRLLAGVEGVVHAVAFRHPAPDRPDDLAALLQLADPGAADTVVARAHRACARALGPDSAPREIMVVTALPLTADGTPRRSLCQDVFRQAIAAGSLPAGPPLQE